MKNNYSKNLPISEEYLIRLSCCPICDQRNLTNFSKRPYDINFSVTHMRCEDCGLIFMNPVPNQDWYDKLYGDFFWQEKSRKMPNKSVWANKNQWYKGFARAEKFWKLLSGHFTGDHPRNILEIGASYGLIGTTLAGKTGGQAYGVEPNHQARAFAEKISGMTMAGETISNIESLHTLPSIDLVIFSHVLENIIDIKKAISSVKAKMADGSLLLIETPNADWQPSMSIYHPYCFSETSLTLLLSKCGFTVERVEKSGEPSLCTIPRYLTLIARLTGDATELAKPPPRSTRTVRRRHWLNRLYTRSILGKIDEKKAWKRYNKTASVTEAVRKIAEHPDIENVAF